MASSARAPGAPRPRASRPSRRPRRGRRCTAPPPAPPRRGRGRAARRRRVLLVERRRSPRRTAPASPATALRSVLPVPATSRMPRGIFAPSRPSARGRAGTRPPRRLGLHLVDALDVGEAVRRVRHRLVRRAPRRGAVRAEQRAERAAEATEVARRRQHAHGHPRRQHVEDATHHLERQALAERQLVLEERARDVGPARRCVLVGRRTGPRRTEDGSEDEHCEHLDLDVSPATAGPAVPVEPKV